MNENQARFVRKLKVDQNCSYPMVARHFYNEFGSTKYCNEENADAIMYFNLENVDDGVKVHQFETGDFTVKSYKLVEYIYSPAVGQQLCAKACTCLDDDPADGWLEFVYAECDEPQ
jgi:hypothetical protein